MARARMRGFFVEKKGCGHGGGLCLVCVCVSVLLSLPCVCLTRVFVWGVRFEGLPWPVGAGKVAGPCPLSSKCHIYMCLRMYVRIHSYIRM